MRCVETTKLPKPTAGTVTFRTRQDTTGNRLRPSNHDESHRFEIKNRKDLQIGALLIRGNRPQYWPT